MKFYTDNSCLYFVPNGNVNNFINNITKQLFEEVQEITLSLDEIYKHNIFCIVHAEGEGLEIINIQHAEDIYYCYSL